MPLTRYRLKMDLQWFAQEKTEKATPKKRQESRKKGQVARSSELPGAFVLLFGFMTITMFAGFFLKRFLRFFSSIYNDFLNMQMTPDNVQFLLGTLMVQMLLILLPLMGVAFVIAIIGNYVQIGALLTGDPLMIKFNKINPLEGAKRIFSMRALVEFVKSMFKLIIIGAIVSLTLWGYRSDLTELSRLPLESTLLFTGKITSLIGLEIAVLLAVLAVFDYFYQRYEFEKSIRMSKQDIKDEYKKSEGDPLIKGKIREKQRRMALQRMMQEVPKADVIITNPTHYAVALKYDQKEMEAPKVTAKGQDFIALKMKEIARNHQVLLMENKPLARAIYAKVEVGEVIPGELFQAVAEVLAYVYQLKGKVSG